jgi:hypothetical protein
MLNLMRGPEMARSEPAYLSYELVHDLHSDLCESSSNHSQRIGRGIGDVDISSGDERTAIIDPDCYGMVATFVTRNFVPNGNVGCAAVKSCVSNFSPLAVSVPSV